MATVSTVSGVGMGIRRLSELCFGVGMFVMVVCFFMDNTFFILNLFVQSIGYYFQVRRSKYVAYQLLQALKVGM